MKKFLLAILIAVCSLTLFSACQKPKEPDGPTESYTVELSATELSLDVYERYTLTAVVKDGRGAVTDKKVEWSSSQSGIVAADDGLLFAKSIGTAKVTATVEGGTANAEVNVNVTMRGYVPRLKLSEETELTLAEGTTFNLSPEVTFKGKTATDSDTTFIYSVSDPSVASVSEGTVTALKAGNTKITVTASWRGLGGAELVGSEDAVGLRITLDLTVLNID